MAFEQLEIHASASSTTYCDIISLDMHLTLAILKFPSEMKLDDETSVVLQILGVTTHAPKVKRQE